MTQSTSKLKINLCLSASLLLLLSLIWWLTNQSNTSDITDKKILPTIRCDFINQLCLAGNKEFEVKLEIESDIIKSFEPLPFKISFMGLDASNVSINFQGIEMFMGSNKLKLEKNTANTFTGTHSLPGHNGYSMTWRAVVQFTHNNELKETWFEFELQ